MIVIKKNITHTARTRELIYAETSCSAGILMDEALELLCKATHYAPDDEFDSLISAIDCIDAALHSLEDGDLYDVKQVEDDEAAEAEPTFREISAEEFVRGINKRQAAKPTSRASTEEEYASDINRYGDLNKAE